MPFKRYFTEYNSEYDKNANSKDSTRSREISTLYPGRGSPR
ncbi:hypothetical protein T10_9736 [Trichinella papuae]|uniref:Uncharacterized protein n=1 Tax=Trichinella papuae TaxID=268474 RepID=A0A0V1LYI4_9BILA|nr:hypothetical protein T10_9736 [Trichinella papuae]